MATVPKGIKCGCFCLGPAPFSCCFAWFEAKRKSGWGICGSSCFGCLFCLCLLDMPTFVILANCAEYHLFHRLCIYQDRATEHLRPNSRKKKKYRWEDNGGGGRTIQAKPATVREEEEPSRGTPWWPPQPLALLLKFVIIYVIGVVQASLAASCFLVYGIRLDCTEHSFQSRVWFLVIKDSFYLLQELQRLVYQILRLLQRSVQDDSYQHCSSIFLEEGRSAFLEPL